jgi:hypothetical protein
MPTRKQRQEDGATPPLARACHIDKTRRKSERPSDHARRLVKLAML